QTFFFLGLHGNLRFIALCHNMGYYTRFLHLAQVFFLKKGSKILIFFTKIYCKTAEKSYIFFCSLQNKVFLPAKGQNIPLVLVQLFLCSVILRYFPILSGPLTADFGQPLGNG